MDDTKENDIQRGNRQLAFAFYAFLFVLGIMLYLGWSAYFGTWNLFAPENIGIYGVTVLLCGFGLFGMLLYRKP